MIENNDSQKQYELLEQSFAEERLACFNCLTKEQQLLIFCEIVHRLTIAELQENKSYRDILYETFEFPPESYIKAQMSDFLDLHNSIEHEPINLIKFGSKLLQIYGIKQSNKEIEDKLKQFNNTN